MKEPLVSVIVRSFNRVPALCELVEALLHQTWSHLEVVVIEQSTKVPPDAAARLADLARDPRVVIIKRAPLGGAAARNVAVERSRGEVLLFIDDDDLPADEDWVANHMKAIEDPNCIGVSGKHIHNDELEHTYSPFFDWFTRTLSYDPILKISMTYVQHDVRHIPVYAIHGTNASLRRHAWERFGGWDEDTAIEDEVSFCFRALKMKRPEEYFAYDPRPVMVRNRDVVGGLDKRRMSIGVFFGHYIDYMHRIIGRYHRVRVVLLYPCYVLLAYIMAVGTIWEHSRKYRNWGRRIGAALELLVTLPVHWGMSIYRLINPSRSQGKVRAARLQPVPASVGDDGGRLAPS